MREEVTRRAAIAAMGVSTGLGAVVGLASLAACGGSTDSDTPPVSGEDPPPSAGGLVGSMWYQSPDGTLKVSAGGIQAPTVVNQTVERDGSYPQFAVSRVGPRYLQRWNVPGSSSSQSTGVIHVHEHATHAVYCFINIPGWVSYAAVSPSGRYVVAMRSPEFALSGYNLGSTRLVVDLMIIDIADVNNIRDIRSTRTEGQAAIYGFQWLADDRFVYMTWGDGNFGDSMYSGSVAAGSQGDRLLGAVDKQGLRIRSFDVHPDGSSMLLSMFSDDGVALGVWDVYQYQLSGQRIDRITAFDQGYRGTWSPDGRHIFFKAGSESGIPCDRTLGCPDTCSSHYVSSSARSVRLADAQTLELDKVPCYSDIMWRG